MKTNSPLMIQGDHGPVAFKNIKYKLYENEKLNISNLVRKEYKSPGKKIGNLDTITKLKETKSKILSFNDVTNKRERKMVTFSGTLSIPKSGNYFFQAKLQELQNST